MSFHHLNVQKHNHILHISLNRPDVRNCFNETLIEELTAVFSTEAVAEDARIVHLGGEGKVFCAGGDLNWMKASLHKTKDENIVDCEKLSHMFQTINNCPRPVVATVQGAALGGGVGLVSVCDYVIAARETQFSFSEARLGLVPATIGPFILAKVGLSHTRALFLSAERFNAEKAHAIGLVHQVVGGEADLQPAVNELLSNMLLCSPQALRTAKEFLLTIKDLPFEKQHGVATECLASIRVTPEGQEGLSAFLEKRKAVWVKKEGSN